MITDSPDGQALWDGLDIFAVIFRQRHNAFSFRVYAYAFADIVQSAAAPSSPARVMPVFHCRQ